MSLITNSYGKPDPKQFNDQYNHKYFCELVQGDVSNDVRQENSVAVTAGTWLPTGSIAYINANKQGVAGIGENSATKVTIPQIVYVGTEHGNVFSEKFNSGCGLITTHPLTTNCDYMTTVFDDAASYEVGTMLTAKEIDFDGKKVFAVTPAAEGETVIGIVRAVPAMHHLGVKGIVFSAYFRPAVA